ncbi:MAG: tRNA 2-thiouridine(34) synthase MnmA [Muribaculaceae bacterium]|nr:tRNA 2-thiouridine(34) synthase MnmA [Muribaculaceae bacterium]
MKIAVLISGGVDSAVVVHKLFNEGHDLHLFYIRIGMDNDEGDCSAEEDIEMCTLIARKYGLPLKVVSLHQEYWDNVMDYALKTVEKGLTPHPDMMCNKLIKFGYFEQRWGHEFDKTATGHYARVIERNGRFFLGTGVDAVKDQTDFLAQISYSQLSHLLFPLGSMSKAEVRSMAAEAVLPNASRKDSQGICFLGKINYNDFLRRTLGERKGPVIEIETGRKIGEHKGFWFYTIGQRKGLGLSGGPWFVVRKNVRDNVIYVSNGYETSLQYGRTISIEEMNWISGDPFSSAENQWMPDSIREQCEKLMAGGGDAIKSLRVSFKTRHTPEFMDALMTCEENGSWCLEADSDVQGIAPGQFAIIYTPDREICLGSGMISLPQSRRRKRVHHSSDKNID